MIYVDCVREKDKFIKLTPYFFLMKTSYVLALVILAEEEFDIPYISEKLALVKDKLPFLLIKKIPGGYWSEDAAIFARLLCEIRGLEKTNNINYRITEKGKWVLKEILKEAKEECSDELEEVCAILGYKLDELL